VVVAVAHASVEHVGDRLEAAVRVVGEAGQVVLGAVGAELVEQQEGIEVGQARAADDAGQLHPGAVGCGHAAHLAGDAGMAVGSGRVHAGSSWEMPADMVPRCGPENPHAWNAGCHRSPQAPPGVRTQAAHLDDYLTLAQNTSAPRVATKPMPPSTSR